MAWVQSVCEIDIYTITLYLKIYYKTKHDVVTRLVDKQNKLISDNESSIDRQRGW